MLLYLSFALLVLTSWVHTAFAYEEPYLAPHEERFFNALDNINKDFNAFMKIFAKNAYCEFSSGKDPEYVAIKSGHCRELLSNYKNLDEFKARWYPLTNTDPKQPERGVFTHAYVNYGLSNNGCEGLFQGLAEVKFNVGGQITEIRAHSSGMMNFMNCIDGNQQSGTIQEEEIYLAPHEQKLYDAVNNADQDFDAFLDFFENAHCETIVGQAPADITVMKGPCKEEWHKYSNVIRNKEMWMPVTNTHAKYPDKGVLALKFWNYFLAGNGCEGLTGGTATITFKKNGEVTKVKSYLDSDDLMSCYRGNVNVEA